VNIRITYRILVENPERKRTKLTYEHDIKTNLSETEREHTEWIDLA